MDGFLHEIQWLKRINDFVKQHCFNESIYHSINDRIGYFEFKNINLNDSLDIIAILDRAELLK